MIDYKRKPLILDSTAVSGTEVFFRNPYSVRVHGKVIRDKLNEDLNAQYVHYSIQDSVLFILAKSVLQDIL